LGLDNADRGEVERRREANIEVSLTVEGGVTGKKNKGGLEERTTQNSLLVNSKKRGQKR